MEFLENQIDPFEMAIWETIKSISDVKENAQKRATIKHDELLCLQNKLMEATAWIKNHTTE